MERSSSDVSLLSELPRSYLEAIERVAVKQGWRIEQRGSRYYLRSIEPFTLRKRSGSGVPTPSNHLPFFNSLSEIHAFLTNK